MAILFLAQQESSLASPRANLLNESDPGYQSLKEETETLVAGFQKALKTKIIKLLNWK
jgi:hypothetical protein